MCRLLLMTIACLMILFGLSGLYMMPKLIQQKIEQRMQLKIGTKSFDRFTKVPIPLTVKIYFFNISNSDKVLEGTERPKFEEVGPFMFKQWRRRDIIDFLDYNRKLRYREYKTFFPIYPPNSTGSTSTKTITTTTRHNNNNNSINNINNNSIGSSETHQRQQVTRNTNDQQHTQEDKMLDPRQVNITIINLPLLTVLTQLAKLEGKTMKRNLASKVVSGLIADKRDKILMTRPANELLFDGTRVKFMESAKDLVSDVLGFNFDSPLPNNKFGFFYLKNNTWTRNENGELTVFTGRNESMSDFMLIENWNDLKHLKVWPSNTVAGDRCNDIRGTDGSQFHPGVRRDQVLELFSPLVCTSLHVVYKEDTQARDIPLLRFITPSELFAAPRKNPRNACYCTVGQQQLRQSHLTSGNGGGGGNKGINDSRCYLDGLMDLSLCQKGAPVAASSPHFYNADPMLAMAAGLKPNKDIHQTYLDIEPMTGAVMRAASRAQINAYVEQSALDVIDSSVIGHMTPMVAPIFWLEESAEIDEKSSAEFKGQLLTLVQKAHRSFIYSIVIGILLAVAVSLQYWYVACYSIDTDELSRQKKERLKKRRKIREQQRSRLRRNETTILGVAGRGARHSNRENMKKPMLPDLGVKFVANADVDDDDDGDEPATTSSGSDTAKATLIGGVAAIALGAASAGPSNTRRQQHQVAATNVSERRPRSAGRSSGGSGGATGMKEAAQVGQQQQQQPVKVTTLLNDNNEAENCTNNNEEELSRKMLVTNEWKPGTATSDTSTSTGGNGGGGDGQINMNIIADENDDNDSPPSKRDNRDNNVFDNNNQQKAPMCETKMNVREKE